jgi:hypothetical protein
MKTLPSFLNVECKRKKEKGRERRREEERKNKKGGKEGKRMDILYF